MKQAISLFLEKKQLSINSQKAYQYDLEQFLEVCKNQLTSSKMSLYQTFLEDFPLSVQRRKYSAVNQFLWYLYEQGLSERYYKLHSPSRRSSSAPRQLPQLEDLSTLYQETPFLVGQQIALLVVELGLLPHEIAQIQQENIDRNFQILQLSIGQKQRVLPLSKKLLSYFEEPASKGYLFENRGKSYSRQWFYNRLSEFTNSIGKSEWTAQRLRDQYIVRELHSGKTIDEVARNLGLSSPMGLEKYR